MKSNHILNNLDEISFDQAIFSNKIYRKICNLDESYSVYSLEFKNNCFMWEKIPNFKLIGNCECISFENLVYVRDKGNDKHITVYNTEGNYATKLMIYTGNNTLIWDILNIPFDINNLNTHSLLDIPTHVNLLNECQNETFDLLDEFEPISHEPISHEPISFEPLHGWSNLLERSSDTEENTEEVVLDNDLDENISVKDNFVYPDMDDEDNITLEEMDEDTTEEYRIDPYDNEWYTENEFLEYYGSLTEWEHQNPKSILLREEYYRFTTYYWHLDEKKFIYLFKQYEKTF